jgi:hypothetical protein
MHRIDTDYARGGLTGFAPFWVWQRLCGRVVRYGRTARARTRTKYPDGADWGPSVSSGRGMLARGRGVAKIAAAAREPAWRGVPLNRQYARHRY